VRFGSAAITFVAEPSSASRWMAPSVTTTALSDQNRSPPRMASALGCSALASRSLEPPSLATRSLCLPAPPGGISWSSSVSTGSRAACDLVIPMVAPEDLGVVAARLLREPARMCRSTTARDPSATRRRTPPRLSARRSARPWRSRPILAAAVAPALASDVTRPSRLVRTHEGPVDEVYSQTNVYSTTLSYRDEPAMRAPERMTFRSCFCSERASALRSRASPQLCERPVALGSQALTCRSRSSAPWPEVGQARCPAVGPGRNLRLAPSPQRARGAGE
jgi:hypothetical protein